MSRRTTAYLGGKEIKVLKGLYSKEGDFFVEILIKEVKKTISVWKLNYPNSNHANSLFRGVFGISFREAKKIHVELKNKKEEKRKNIKLLTTIDHNLKTVLNDYPKKDYLKN